MKRAFLIGIPPVEVTLRRSDRARRFSLRVSRLDGRVTLSLPRWAAEAEALRFAHAQEDWIRKALAAQTVPQPVTIGESVLFEGSARVITVGPVRSVRVEGAALIVPLAAAADPGARIEAFLKLAARQRLQVACERHSGMLGRPFARITLRDTRSRWGSCSAAGNLMFSWRLILAPPEVLDYVAAHEVAHLVQMNHSGAFWAEVRRLVPGYGVHRDWLRQHGARLQAIRFRD